MNERKRLETISKENFREVFALKRYITFEYSILP